MNHTPYSFGVDAEGCVAVPLDVLVDDPGGVFEYCRGLSPVIKAGPLHLVISGPDVLELLSGSRMKQVKQFEGEMMVLRGHPLYRTHGAISRAPRSCFPMVRHIRAGGRRS